MMPSNLDKNVKMVSSIELNGRLYEEIYDSDTGIAKFVFYDEKNNVIKEVEYVEDADTRYLPLIDKFVTIQAVLLPKKAEDYESEEKLLLDIQHHIHKYIDISEEDEKLCSWVIPTYYLYDKINTMIPYLRALGDTGCGKSRFLDVLGGLCYKTLMIGGSVTPAIMYRAAEKWRGTMIIDEADWKKTDEYSEVTKILNCNQPNRKILRCKADNYDNIEVFDSWGPKIFATRHNFEDVATESRMLTIQMKETSRDDIPIVLDEEYYREQNRLRNQLLVYRLKNWNRVTSSIRPAFNLEGIEPRGQQIIYPIGIVFNHKQEILDNISQIMFERQTELIKDRSTSDDGIIINIYLELIQKGQKHISSSDLADIASQRGYDKLTSQYIGHCLKSMGLTNKVQNVAGKSKRCFYCDPETLGKLQRRYFIESEQITSDDNKKLQQLQGLQHKGGSNMLKELRELIKRRKHSNI